MQIGGPCHTFLRRNLNKWWRLGDFKVPFYSLVYLEVHRLAIEGKQCHFSSWFFFWTIRLWEQNLCLKKVEFIYEIWEGPFLPILISARISLSINIYLTFLWSKPNNTFAFRKCPPPTNPSYKIYVRGKQVVTHILDNLDNDFDSIITPINNLIKVIILLTLTLFFVVNLTFAKLKRSQSLNGTSNNFIITIEFTFFYIMHCVEIRTHLMLAHQLPFLIIPHLI